MKVSTLLLAGMATLASAAPLRILVVSPAGAVSGPTGPIGSYTKLDQTLSAIRIGHAAAHLNQDTPIQPRPHLGCGQHLRSKAIAMSNSLREALGLPPIHPEFHVGPAMPHRGDFKILPFIPGQTSARVAVPDDFVRMSMHMRMTRPEDQQPPPFVVRLHGAMNHLGPWEGRAVAFVLGCGLGVLIRMLFVFTLLLFRARAQRSSSANAIRLNEDNDAEAYVILPPRYSTDEKVVLVSTETPAPGYSPEGEKVATEKA